MAFALTSFHVVILFGAAIVFIAAAISDVRSYRIPNYLCALLLILFPAYAATAPYTIDWRQNIVVFGLVSVFGFAAFSGRWMGAGDVKLLSAASLWAGPHLIPALLVITAFVGGLESLAAVFALYLKRPKAEGLMKAPIPYGLAIAVGGIATLGMMAQPLLLPD
jgi:prepilin peptidase CpaA